MFKGKHANGRHMLEIARTHFEQIGQVSNLKTKMGPGHVLMASFSCFPIVFQRAKNQKFKPPIHGPFTLWEVLSRCGRSFSRIFTGIHAYFATIPALVLRARRIKHAKLIYVCICFCSVSLPVLYLM